MSEPLPPPTADSLPQPARTPLLWLAVWLVAVPLVLLVDRPLYEAYTATVGSVVALDWVAQFLTYAVTPKWIALGAVVLTLALPRLRWWFLADMGIVMAVQAGAGEVLKRVFGRVRPEDIRHTQGFHGPDFSHSYYCFPSGHALAAFALAGLLSAWAPRWRWAFIAGAIAVCLARVQLQRHFPADLLFGAWVGWALSGALITWRVQWTRRRDGGTIPEA